MQAKTWHQPLSLSCKRFAKTNMTNLEVAQCFVHNALAYGKSGDLRTVMNNLEYIDKLLEEPNKENPDYDWENFK